jgi:hypothetical protein
MMLKYGLEYCGHPLLLDRVCSRGTPLHCSAEKGNVATCDILLKAGADVNAKNIG